MSTINSYSYRAKSDGSAFVAQSRDGNDAKITITSQAKEVLINKLGMNIYQKLVSNSKMFDTIKEYARGKGLVSWFGRNELDESEAESMCAFISRMAFDSEDKAEKFELTHSDINSLKKQFLDNILADAKNVFKRYKNYTKLLSEFYGKKINFKWLKRHVPPSYSELEDGGYIVRSEFEQAIASFKERYSGISHQDLAGLLDARSVKYVQAANILSDAIAT